jgi:hypothetical protein
MDSLNAIKWVQDHRMSSQLADAKIAEYEAKPQFRTLRTPASTLAPKPSAPAAPDFEHGAFYMVDGVVYRVKLGSRGFFYAEELQGNSFNYAPGAIRRIRVSDRMTLEQAKEYGLRTHTCGCCGRTLTNPDSIAMGIGPICAAKHF